MPEPDLAIVREQHELVHPAAAAFLEEAREVLGTTVVVADLEPGQA